jgi:hypothetical protein
MLDLLGESYVRELVAMTHQVEANGGMLTLDGSRPRTRGGIFFHLARERLTQEGHTDILQRLFSGPDARGPGEPVVRQPPIIPRVRRRKKGKMPPRPQAPIDRQQAFENLHRPGINQNHILSTIERHIGHPPDLRKRSMDARSGHVTLLFNFPEVARQEYGARLEAAAQEAGVAIDISPRVNQMALQHVAMELLPASVTIHKISILQATQTIKVRCEGNISPDDLLAARETFQARTGWQLELVAGEESDSPADTTTDSSQQHIREALQERLGDDLLKASLDPATRTITVRFAFPDAMQPRYAQQLAELEQQLEWSIMVSPAVHQGKLEHVVRETLQAHDITVLKVSLHQQDRLAVAKHLDGIEIDDTRRAAIQTRVSELTGWHLILTQV